MRSVANCTTTNTGCMPRWGWALLYISTVAGVKASSGRYWTYSKDIKNNNSKYLNGLFFEEHQRFVKFSAAQFEKSMEKSQKTAQRNERLEAHISSERKSDYAPDYHCSTLTTSPTGELQYNLLSYLSLAFPIGWLKDETRRAEFEEWVDYLCAQFDVLHGYAGLECILPYGCEEWEPHEYQVATHYYNVMPNCNAYAGLRDYKDAAKSIAWYTILSKSLFMRIEPQVLHLQSQIDLEFARQKQQQR